MAITLAQAANAFTTLATRIEVVWPQILPSEATFRSVSGYNATPLSAENAAQLAHEISERLMDLAPNEDANSTDAPEVFEALAMQAAQIDFASFTSDPANVARSTFEFLLFAAIALPPRKVDVDWDKVENANTIPRTISTRLKSLEDRVNALNPRILKLSEKAAAVERAHDAAEKLPTSLAELNDAQKVIEEFRKSAEEDQRNIELAKGEVLQRQEDLRRLTLEAQDLVAKCKDAYAITTATGLAGAFEARADSLKASVFRWTLVLIFSLLAAVGVGQMRFESIKMLLQGEHSWPVVLLNIAFVIIGVGAPVWLAWLSTHHIGRAARLSEDYAFKSAVSKAYVGFKEEAASLDQEFAKRLFGSALDRLDELPSRLVAKGHDNSPIEALLKSDQFLAFWKKWPEAGSELKYMLENNKAVTAIAAAVGVSTAATKAKKPKEEEPDT